MRHVIDRVARLSFTIVLMNYAAVAALAALGRRRPLWR
jgi:hypothetical protein